MKLTNDNYLILMSTGNFTERYYRDKTGWLKVSARGRTFRMTAEQVLNHVLPALAGIKRDITITVEHREPLLPKGTQLESPADVGRNRGSGYRSSEPRRGAAPANER